ncbi:MAG: hypothetical protein IPH35_23660 [Rhodoferax sp.]|nr:hypothetical protein [Rhodoferax sp.]
MQFADARQTRLNGAWPGDDVRAEFGCLWQDRVRRIVLKHAHVQHPRRLSDTALCGATQMAQEILVVDPD